MTEEKKQAIENLKQYIKKDEIYNGTRKNLSDFDEFCINHCMDINIVLHLIQKQQEEIKKKDKQIDLMVDLIYEVATSTPGTTFYYLRKIGFDDSKCKECNLKDCKECIKQYFKRKAEEV